MTIKRFDSKKLLLTSTLFFVFVIGLCPFTIGISSSAHKHFFAYAEKKVKKPAAAAAAVPAEAAAQSTPPAEATAAVQPGAPQENSTLYDYEKPQVEESSFVWLIFKTIFVLGLLAAGFYYFYRFVTKKVGVGLTGRDVAHVIAAVPLGPNKTIQIVDMAGKLLVLGVTDSNINLISEIRERDEIDRIKLLSSKSQAVPAASSFQEFLNVHVHDVIDYFQNRKNASQGKNASAVKQFSTPEEFNPSEEEIARLDFLREQKERLKKMNGYDNEK